MRCGVTIRHGPPPAHNHRTPTRTRDDTRTPAPRPTHDDHEPGRTVPITPHATIAESVHLPKKASEKPRPPTAFTVQARALPHPRQTPETPPGPVKSTCQIWQVSKTAPAAPREPPVGPTKQPRYQQHPQSSILDSCQIWQPDLPRTPDPPRGGAQSARVRTCTWKV